MPLRSDDGLKERIRDSECAQQALLERVGVSPADGLAVSPTAPSALDGTSC